MKAQPFGFANLQIEQCCTFCICRGRLSTVGKSLCPRRIRQSIRWTFERTATNRSVHSLMNSLCTVCTTMQYNVVPHTMQAEPHTSLPCRCHPLETPDHVLCVRTHWTMRTVINTLRNKLGLLLGNVRSDLSLLHAHVQGLNKKKIYQIRTGLIPVYVMILSRWLLSPQFYWNTVTCRPLCKPLRRLLTDGPHGENLCVPRTLLGDFKIIGRPEKTIDGLEAHFDQCCIGRQNPDPTDAVWIINKLKFIGGLASASNLITIISSQSHWQVYPKKIMIFVYIGRHRMNSE